MSEDTIRFIGPYGTLYLPARLLPDEPGAADRLIAELREAIKQPLRTPAVDSGDISGIERLRETIRRDRGGNAPGRPLVLCGEPDGTEVRADGQPILDHAPKPGPAYWEWRCLVCSQRVDHHAGILARWRWRRAQRRARS
jgi:hypothetical protein